MRSTAGELIVLASIRIANDVKPAAELFGSKIYRKFAKNGSKLQLKFNRYRFSCFAPSGKTGVGDFQVLSGFFRGWLTQGQSGKVNRYRFNSFYGSR